MSGIAVPSPERYSNYLLQNVNILRNNLGYADPIEIWEVGEELSSETRNKLMTFDSIHFKNTTEFDDRIEHWRGFQAKAPVLKHSRLNDIIICDADVTLLQNPSIIQHDKKYLETGSYFFRDLEFWKFNLAYQCNNPNLDKFYDRNYYLNRRNFIKNLQPIKLDFFPNEWDHIYSDDIPLHSVAEAHVESGVFYINRNMHDNVINTFYDLNNDWKESYKYVHGDKELTWLSFIKNNKPFSINDYYPLQQDLLIQIYKSAPFYVQKLLLA